MKHKALSVVLLILLVSSFLSYASRYTPYHSTFFSAYDPGTELQTEKPPKQNYMKRLLGRGTEPLGLKENKTLNQLLGQPQIKWVIRSEQRHILN
jgi:hypothetical protein